MCRSLLSASSVLVACISLFGQNPPSVDPTKGNFSQGQPAAEHGIYVSGLALPDKGKNSYDLNYDLMQVLAVVRTKWYPQILELQKSAGMNRGTTVIKFEIKKDGSLGKMKTIESSGSGSLDDVARQAIESSAPFASLPEDRHGKAVELQMYFGYNQPASAEAPFCDGPNLGAHPVEGSVVYRVGNGIKTPHATYDPAAEYSEEARTAKYQSEVTVAGTVDLQGAFTDLCLVQAAGFGLDEQAMRAVRTWKFEPARLQGQPVAVRLTVETTFRLY